MKGEFSLTPIDNLREIIREVVQETISTHLSKDNKREYSDEYFTRKEACKFLRMGATKFNELRRNGIVKPIRHGRKTLYKKSDLLNLNVDQHK